ncbi:chromosomal replication initiator protein DnaA [Candidatus Woesebacteria bacterium]|nr:chromosomal replication initiator protein DnaA [Candidatus Woesebacteria bacterium]
MTETQELKTTWSNVLESVRVSVSDATYKTWISQTHLAACNKISDRYVAEIGCNSSFVKTTLESRYFGMIQDTLTKELGNPCDLLFTVKVMKQSTDNNSFSSPLFNQKPDSALDSEEFKNILQDSGLRSSYNFENFAVSSSNQMAHAAAEAVAREPGRAYNPLFIWGGVGVGKTHLMSAIGYSLLKSNPNLPVRLCTGEQFTNDIVEGIRNKTTSKVRAKYRKLNVLLIDDIQFIAGKDAVQVEFFHTFNTVTGAGGQIIMTSDKPPTEIPKLEERLRSRFEAGLTVDIAPLDFELRCAICMIKAKERGVQLPSDLVALIAGNATSARQVEGNLVKIIAESRLKNIPITETLVKSHLGSNGEEIQTVKATADEVIKVACKYFSLLKRDLLGARRARPLARPRQIVMYILRTELQLPFEEIGRVIGGRDHTTVMHAVNKIAAMAANDVKIREDIVGIKNSLSGQVVN